MRIKKSYLSLSFLFILGLLGGLYTSAYLVPEGQRALIYCRDNTSITKTPGLHFRLPWLSLQPRFYEYRLQQLILRSDPITLHEFGHLQMEVCIYYRITNPASYFARLDKSHVSDNVFIESFTSELNRYLRSVSPVLIEDIINSREALSPIAIGLEETSLSFGIEITNISILHLHLSNVMRAHYYERMNKDYDQLNSEYRIQGTVKVGKIRTDAQNDVANLINAAKEKAEYIRGQADIFAIERYHLAYQKYPKFAQWYQKLIAAQRNIDAQSQTLILFQLDSLLNSNPLATKLF